MHEIYLAQNIINDLQSKKFDYLELEVGEISIHEDEESKERFKKLVKKAFPHAEIKINILPPTFYCSCGYKVSIHEGTDICQKCGRKMKLNTHEGYKIVRLS